MIKINLVIKVKKLDLILLLNSKNVLILFNNIIDNAIFNIKVSEVAILLKFLIKN